MVLCTLFVFEDPLFVLFSLDDTRYVVLITFVWKTKMYTNSDWGMIEANSWRVAIACQAVIV